MNHAPQLDEDYLLDRIMDCNAAGRPVPDELREEVVRLFWDDVFRLCVRRGLDPDTEAAHQTQEAFIKVHRNLHRFRGEARLRTWIYRIAVNTLHDHFQSAQRDRETTWTDAFAGEDDSTEPEAEPDPGLQPVWSLPCADPQAILEREEMVAAVHCAVGRLPADQRLAVSLQLAGCDLKAIAATMGRSVPAVKMLISRARRVLKAKLSALVREHTYG